MEMPPDYVAPSPEAAIDTLALRRAFGAFPTGVTVVTARAADGRTVGVTMNSFSSVSLEPPLVLWSLAEKAPSRPVFVDATHFAIHVLAADQKNLSDRFCAPASDKFAGLALSDGLGGAPVFGGTAALFECRRRFMYYGGDHVIFVGEVERYTASDAPPLLFHRGRYAGVNAD